MDNNLKFRVLAIVAVAVACVFFIIGIPKSKAEILANWNSNIHLGLDLTGGSELVLRVNLQDAFKASADAVMDKLKDAMRTATIEYTAMDRNDPQTIEEADTIQINVTGVPAVKAAAFRQVFKDNFDDFWNLTPVGQTDYHLTMKPTQAIALKEQTLTSSINTIGKKVNALGLTETSVQKRGGSSADAEIMVQLPRVDDPARVKQFLQEQAKLELYEVLGGPYGSQDQGRQDKGGVLPLNSKLVPSVIKNGAPPEWWLLARTPEVHGQDIRDASAHQNTQSGGWETSFVLSQDVAKKFERFTAAHDQDRGRLAIVLDDRVLSAPSIKSKISDNGVIEGLSGQEEASDLALNLRAGSLPASLEFLEQREVGASLGSDSIRDGVYSGLAGVGAVVVIMLIYYRRSGINAVLALVLNALILLAALSYFGAVLTLPGIAGVILTVGMAVDSNVLIFERIREELRAGKAVPAAVEAGFNKAFLTIIDTHVTTVISCAMLFLFGTGAVQGFAVTLVIGLVANVFTAVFVSKTIFQWELGGQKQVATLSI
jgi:preprotein translocase subunit SecD